MRRLLVLSLRLASIGWVGGCTSGPADDRPGVPASSLDGSRAASSDASIAEPAREAGALEAAADGSVAAIAPDASQAALDDGGTDSDARADRSLGSDPEGADASFGAADGGPVGDGGPATDVASTREAGDAEAGDVVANTTDAECSTDGLHPSTLAQTGLYASWSPDPSRRAIDPRVIAYAPGLTLWSDGAQKRRFILLPASSPVVTDDMDGWVFPVGTKIWKEFSVPLADAGATQLAETRYLCKRSNGTWFRTAYEWSLDGTTTIERPTGDTQWPSAAPPSTLAGAPNIAPTRYEVPSQRSCDKCHGGAVDGVLGFEAISLANGGVLVGGDGGSMTLGDFTAAYPNVFTTPPDPATLTIPGNAVERQALGWLHANCGTSCHNATGVNPLAANYTRMRLTVSTMTSVEATDTYTTGVGIVSTYQPPGASGEQLIAPGDPADSVDFVRAAVRGTTEQMPPIATHVVPADAVSVLRSWIAAMKVAADP